MMLKKQFRAFRAWSQSAIPRDDATASEDARAFISSDLWSFGLGAVVFSFLAGDLIGFIRPEVRGVMGLLIAAGIVSLHRGIASRTAGMRVLWLTPIIIGLLSVIVYGMIRSDDVLATAIHDSEAADIRCATIQAEMLRPVPRRGDLPDIYIALGCHASGRQNITLPGRPKPPPKL